MISSPGVGSGLDVQSLVTQLVQIEQQPLVRLVQKEAGYQGQISAYGALRSALATFESSLAAVNSASDFRVLTAKSSSDSVLTATAGSSASKGTYSLTVERLAETHRLGATNPVADAAAIVGSEGDALTITQDGDSFEIEFGGKSLAEVRDLINDAAGNTGVTASILNDDGGSRLLLSADVTGSDQAIGLSYSGADPFGFTDLNTDRDGDLVFSAADLDAVISVDGAFTATRTTNTIKDVVQGVTLNLVDAGTSVLSVSEDRAAVEKSVRSVVDAYNAALTTIRTLREGPLSGDANSLYSIENQIRAVLGTPASGTGTYSSIYEIGISSTFILGAQSAENGKLNLDTAAFLEALDEDEESVAKLFSDAENGLIPRLESLIGSFVDFDGLIDGKTDSLNRRIEGIATSREVLTRRIEAFEARTLAEFNALDSLVAQLQLSGDFLNQQLAVLQPANG